MSMPLFAWSAYVHRAVQLQNADTLRLAGATSVPHMEKADRMRYLNALQATTVEPEPITKEQYTAQLAMIGIGTELN